MPSLTVTEIFTQARRKGVPLIAVNSQDFAATVATLEPFCTVGDDQMPVVEWDMMRGYVHVNSAGKMELDRVLRAGNPPIIDPAPALIKALDFWPGTTIFFHNMDLVLAKPHDKEAIVVSQGFYNLRDIYTSNRRTAVLLGTSNQLPALLQNDVLLLEEELPSSDELLTIITDFLSDVAAQSLEFPMPDEHSTLRAVDALRGLPKFVAEQTLALSVSKLGLNLDQLWHRKKDRIRQTRGLSVYAGEEKYDQIGGCEEIKDFMKSYMSGPAGPRAIAYIDEIDKAIAGANGDSSGTSQEMHGQLLSFMEDTKAGGVLFVGPPGAAKSAIAKATGNENDLLTITFNLTEMKDQYVGSSTNNLKRSLQTLSAVSDGKPFFVATCNSIKGISPELLRRFKLGTFYFDLPSTEEREIIWGIKKAQYGLTDDHSAVDDTNWTGAEIEKCAYLAHALGKSILESARRVIPYAHSNKERLESMRSEAHNNYLSASYAGPYQKEAEAPMEAIRAVTVKENRKRSIAV